MATETDDQLTRRAPASPGGQWVVPAPSDDAPLRPPVARRPPTDPPEDRRSTARRRGPRSRKQKVLLGLGIFSVVVLLVAAGAVAWGLVQFNNIDRLDVKLAEVAKAEPMNFLIVGSDTRDLSENESDSGAIFGDGEAAEPAGQRADTMLILRVDPARTHLELLSLPRDLLVNAPGSTKRERLNAAYNTGAQHLIDTIQGTLGVEINHYVEVNFSGFKGLVDAIGGVQMYFGTPMRDRHTGFNIIKAGCYNLSPQQALAFARSRHLEHLKNKQWIEDATADLGRITRQQTFIRRAMAKVSTLGITDVNTLRKLIEVAVGTVRIDDALSLDDMITLGRRYAKFDAKALVTHRLPANSIRYNGNAVLEMDAAASAGVLDVFRGVAPPTPVSTAKEPPAPPIVASAVTVDVHNGTKRNQLAAGTGDELAALGFKIAAIDSSPAPVAATQLRFGKGGEAAAVLVASHISPTPAMVEDPTMTGKHLALDLGPDFSKVTVEQTGPSATTAPTATVAGGGPAPTTTVPEADKPIGYVTGDPPPGVDCKP